jgi:chemotaxis response regulator CheB
MPLMLGIGASTGGPRALAKLLGELPHDYPLPIAVVQHMAEDFFDSFVRFLGDASRRKVETAHNGVLLQPGRVYVAPPRQELFVKESMTVRLLPPPPDALISPSVDSLFFSMATALKGRGIGVLLTGMGDDGAQGLLRMRRMGARTVAQDRASSAVFGMPRAAQELGAVEVVLPLEDMAKWLVETVKPSVKKAAPGTAPASPSTSTSQSKLQPVVSGKKRILVVDDDAKAAQKVKGVLEGAGFEVRVLDNALMMASTLRKSPVELVLFETELSTVRGLVVLKTLQEHGLTSVPIFLHSRLELSALKARAKECSAVGFVEKDAPGLVREISAFLGGAKRS